MICLPRQTSLVYRIVADDWGGGGTLGVCGKKRNGYTVLVGNSE
jgi:hypothetical protein